MATGRPRLGHTRCFPVTMGVSATERALDSHCRENDGRGAQRVTGRPRPRHIRNFPVVMSMTANGKGSGFPLR